MTKPFRGVIKNWYRDGDVVVGDCEYHRDQEPLSAAAILNNGIVQNHGMHTSRVMIMHEFGAFTLCETKNSYYVLTEPRL
jgi:hypothetical protein